MSERVCQFYIRGRCQRENCEFKHEKPEKSASDAKETQEMAAPVVARKVCDYLFDSYNVIEPWLFT